LPEILQKLPVVFSLLIAGTKEPLTSTIERFRNANSLQPSLLGNIVFARAEQAGNSNANWLRRFT
jgi:hypothetical protein